MCFLIDDLGPGDLGTICEELATVKYKWRDIGLKLRVPYHRLKEFEKDSNPLMEVINYWLNGNVEDVPVTWRSLVAVLESSTVDERGLAKTFMKKYCPSEQQKGQEWGGSACSPPPPPSPPPTPTPPLPGVDPGGGSVCPLPPPPPPPPPNQHHHIQIDIVLIVLTIEVFFKRLELFIIPWNHP